MLFGGEVGKSYNLESRNITNDLVILDKDLETIEKHQLFDKNFLTCRTYHTGFIIENTLYSMGGLTNGSKVLSDNTFIDLKSFKFGSFDVQNN